MANYHNCGQCHTHSHCNCNQTTPVLGQISGEILGTNEIALIQNGVVIGKIPIIASEALDLLDAFGNPIPES